MDIKIVTIEGGFQATVLTFRAADELSRKSATGRKFTIGERFTMTAVGLFQMTRACTKLVLS